MKTRLSNWREESDLYEVVTGKMTDKEALKKVDDKKGINNKVIINPKLSEAMEELGGEVVSVDEALAPSKQELNIMKKVNLLQLRLQKEKKKTTQKAEQAAKQKDDIPVQQEEVGVSSSAAMAKARKEAQLKAKEEEAVKKAKKVKEDFESVVEYFYAEGINEEGIDLIIEEVGLDDFVDFVDDSAQFLSEERSARKMNVRTLKATKKKAEEIKASKKDVVARGTPSDTLARARTERSLKKPKLAKPAAKKEAPAPTKAKKAATVIKKARKATVAKARKDFDGDGRVETPKSEHRGVRNKKITKAVAKAKPAQPKKPASKEGLRAKIKSAYDAGVKRHRKATQGVRVFHKGMKAGAKKAVKFAKDVKKVVSEEELKERLGGKGYKSYTSLTGKKVSGDWEDSDRGAGNKATRRAGGKVGKKSPTYRAYVLNKEEVVLEKDLNAKERRALPDSDFVFPGKGEGPEGKQRGAYPINDKKHARAALAMAAAHASPEKEAKVKAAVKKKYPGIKVSEAKVDTGSPEAKASARNKRNTPPGKDYKFDTSVFITRKPGESLDSARTRKRREAHSKKRGMKEDRALEIVRANIIKKHGKGAIYDPKNPPKAQPKPKAKPDTRTAAQKKKDQDWANIYARYGGKSNYEAGRGLGT